MHIPVTLYGMNGLVLGICICIWVCVYDYTLIHSIIAKKNIWYWKMAGKGYMGHFGEKKGRNKYII